jgi:hypothetical protein
MPTISDVRPFHRAAVLASVDVVSVVTRDDLRRPTPCAGWNLVDLLAHMTVQHHGFAAAACGVDSPTVWEPARVADAVATDPGGTYAAAAADVLDAFAVDGVLDATLGKEPTLWVPRWVGVRHPAGGRFDAECDLPRPPRCLGPPLVEEPAPGRTASSADAKSAPRRTRTPITAGISSRSTDSFTPRSWAAR